MALTWPKHEKKQEKRRSKRSRKEKKGGRKKEEDGMEGEGRSDRDGGCLFT